MAINKTKNLNIIYLAQNQTNKEILVNEGFLKFDSLMNNGAKSSSLATPPANPEESDLYIVGTFATGDWEGHENKFTYYHPSKGWVILQPNEGMTLWVNDEDKLYTFDGTNWVTSVEFDNLTELGINATADTTDKLTVKSEAVLFDNNGDDSQVKVNKAAAGDTASHLFQTNYSGRAEFGLTGDDNFHIKVSADGSAWNEPIVINKDNGDLTVNGAVKFNNDEFSVGRFIRHNDDADTYFNFLPNRVLLEVGGYGVLDARTDSGYIRYNNELADLDIQFGSTKELNSFSVIGSSGDCVVKNKIRLGAEDTAFIAHGTGSPEDNLSATVGSTFHRTDGGASTSFYVKESGTGNTGWIAK